MLLIVGLQNVPVTPNNTVEAPVALHGMARSRGQYLQISAGQNLIATAGKNAGVSVVKNLFIGGAMF